METRIVERAPTLAEYLMMRHEVGWDEVDAEAAAVGLESALFSVCIVREDGEIVGCARVVGDGGLYLYIQDVIVRPAHQGRGLGRLLMDEVMGFVASTARTNTFVGLMAARGVADFYVGYGFQPRPADRPGMFRMWSDPPGPKS
jgi:predicted GNAT family N-acyltransferase